MKHTAAPACVLCTRYGDGPSLDPADDGRVWPLPHEVGLVRAIVAYASCRELFAVVVESVERVHVAEDDELIASGVCRMVIDCALDGLGRDDTEIRLVCGLEGACLACKRLRVAPAIAEIGDPPAWGLDESWALAKVRAFAEIIGGAGAVAELGVGMLRRAAGDIRSGAAVGDVRNELDHLLGLLESA